LRDNLGPAGLAGIGVGVPGFIRMKEGFITSSNNLPYLENFPVRDEISRRLGTRVILENDANAAALGEKWMGAGRGVDDLVLLTLYWHHGGIISCGRVRGFVGMAGELGHVLIQTATRAGAEIRLSRKHARPPPSPRWRACCNWARTHSKDVYEPSAGRR
jgi:glucokinase